MENHVKKNGLIGLTIAAVGIVYGDIGTSPLYALKECFNEAHGISVTPANVIGVVSLIVWSLLVVVSLKYITLVLRADNRGEGGAIALIALAVSSVGKSSRLRTPVILLGLFGASLFYGDGVITPAISVLSAVEGLEVATPAFTPYVLPISLSILTALYFSQKQGTGRIGFLFGPIMIVWFVTLAILGAYNVIKAPIILNAFNPINAFFFFIENGWIGFAVLGAIVLCVTGVEALYADLGHFGHKPIRVAWSVLVFPALMLSYLGQGALLLMDPASAANPFYKQVPAAGVLPLVALSTVATVIASQATISGTFSITRQAIQLGYLPRMNVIHTSDASIGQIYIPTINWSQYTLVVLVIIAFGSSSSLAAAYGIAVTGTMLITTLLTFFVTRYGWKYNLLLCIGATGFFFVIDIAFFGSTILKLADGGWFPMVLGLVIFTLMTTWKQGRFILKEHLARQAIQVEEFLNSLMISPPVRVPGTAVFLRSEVEGVPHALMHNLNHNKILHERVILTTVHIKGVPYISPEERLKVTPLGHNCFQIDIYYGFKDEPDIPSALGLLEPSGIRFEPLETSYFLSRQSVIPTLGEGMRLWRERLFATMVRNAANPAEYYNLPVNRVVELGTQIEI